MTTQTAFDTISARNTQKGIIATVLAFLDRIAELNARNKNYEPFGL